MWSAAKGMIRRQRFVSEDIERRSLEIASMQHVREGEIVDQLAAGGVDHDRGSAKEPKLLSGEQATGASVQR